MIRSRALLVSLLASVAATAACSSSSASSASADGGEPPADGGEPPADGSVTVDGGSDAGATGNGLAWTSGTRLHAIVTTAETARRFSAWHDVQLDVDCAYGLASDGRTRCLPVVSDTSAEYDDSSCTNPVALVPGGGTPAKYLAPPYAKFVCGKGTEYHAPGAAYVPAALYTFDGARCVLDTYAHTGVTYVHFGAVVPPATFVAGSEASDPRGARLSAHQLVGDDGSRQDFEMLDGSRGGAACEVTDDGTGAYYCTPKERAYLEYFFADSTCKVPVAFHPEYAQQVCGRIPTAVQDSTGKATVLTFYEVGARDTATVFEDNGACVPIPAETASNGTFYTVGAPLPLASLASLTVANEGGGRIRLIVARTESGALGAALGFFDTLKSAACSAQLALDGEIRCLPSTRFDVRSYTDAKCTEGVLEVATGTAPPPAGTLLRGQGALPSSSAIYVIGAKIAAPAGLWQWNGETCQAGSVQAVDYYGTAAVAPADFVRVTIGPE